MFREIKPQEIKDNPFELIGKEWLLVAANKDGKSNAMTASWGAVGEMWGKSVVMIVIRPQRYTKTFLDQKTVDSWYPDKDFHTLYIAEIEKVLVK